jgi:hypothetical protein
MAENPDSEENLKKFYEDALCCHLENKGKKYIKNKFGLFYNKN